jgi:hypothetical protein
MSCAASRSAADAIKKPLDIHTPLTCGLCLGPGVGGEQATGAFLFQLAWKLA